MKSLAIAAVGLVLAVPTYAQTAPSAPTTPEAPSMTTPATTMAPVEAGSRTMHEVPTPSVDKRSTSIGTGQKLTGRGGN